MKTKAHHIAVVEDEPVTRAKLAGYFEAEGYRVSEAEDGTAMWRILAGESVDLLLLDINLPGEDGLSLTREIRKQTDIAIILVTGRTDEVDRVVGLELGADDYVTKPFSQRELLARVKNLLRRREDTHKSPSGEKRFAGWTFDLLRRRLLAPDGQVHELTRAEYELLAGLAEHPGVVMSRERLMQHVTHRRWDPGDRTIDVLVRRLRGKLESDPKHPRIIITAHGEGYVFAAEVTGK